MAIRAGMVSATLQIISILICSELSAIFILNVALKGAMLNQAANVKKKAVHVRWRMPSC